ncbi:MAG TPA: DUF5666 domain-containing protein [Bryobacteraceae bacterium]|nr:DUF5666 domain-containing protein [Bryobacteraceae bacterium]
MAKFLLCVGICLILSGWAQAQQSTPEEKRPDAFFSGTVIESTPQRISVSRRISGRQEKRTFRVTPETKIEGKLQAKVRVTVQYSTQEDGSSTATRIVVHSAAPKK